MKAIPLGKTHRNTNEFSLIKFVHIQTSTVFKPTTSRLNHDSYQHDNVFDHDGEKRPKQLRGRN